MAPTRHLAASLVAAALLGACGSTAQRLSTTDGGIGTARDGGSDASMSFGDGGLAETLTIQPSNATLPTMSSGGTLQLQAFVTGSPTPVQATWSIVAGPATGTINASTGLFTASGAIGGTVTVQAQKGTLQGQTPLTVKLTLTDNPGNLTAGQQQQLEAGGGPDGGADPAFRWLYPYDLTVFPRGLLPPTMQFDGTPPDAVYVHVSFSTLDYKGFFGSSNPDQVTFAPAIWTSITESAGAQDVVSVQVTKLSGGQVSGPITETWIIAQGTLKGTVYYESRDAFNGGATMRIQPGAAQADVLLANCTVCHYVSANGSTIVAYGQPPSGDFSATYDLTTDAGLLYQEPGERFAFGALTPDGTLLMSVGSVPATNPAVNDWVPDQAGFNGNSPSRLINPRDGGSVAASGWDNTINVALMPAFSPDGKFIAFNHFDTGMGHKLALMSFDEPTASFSGLIDFANDPMRYLGWPSFTPNDEWVLFHADNNADYATWGSEVTQGSGLPDAKADLAIAHVATSTFANLDALNGVKNGQYYLPFGETAEGHMNYMPTVLPVAVGGYYWVVFTSRREYGNTINTPDPYYTDSAQTMPEQPWRKKLWVAALDIDDPEHPSTGAHDISHPAFYLPGQDLLPGNYRGFWALNPCQQPGTSCMSGDQCCTGFCRTATGSDAGASLGDASTSTSFVCVPPQSCANEYEKCMTTSDCCRAAQGYQCINGFCAQPAQ